MRQIALMIRSNPYKSSRSIGITLVMTLYTFDSLFIGHHWMSAIARDLTDREKSL